MMKKLSIRTKIIIFISLLVIGIANMNTLSDYFAGADHALIREMRLVAKQNPRKYQENLDEVVLKHIPLGTSAEVAMEICQKNGFKAGRHNNIRSVAPGFEEVIQCAKKEMRWSLIFSDEYQVFVDIKNKQAGAVTGRAFARLFGSI